VLIDRCIAECKVYEATLTHQHLINITTSSQAHA
jgi:hypothetical protein